MIIKCPRCNNVWNYKGKSKYYACCSSCKASVKLGEIPIKKRVGGKPPTSKDKGDLK